MSGREHTPGPWTYVKDGCAACDEKGVSEFVVVGPPGGYHGQFSHEPDAALIAAAPDMLAALEDARRWMTGMVKETHPLLLRMDAAISRARLEHKDDTP